MKQVIEIFYSNLTRLNIPISGHIVLREDLIKGLKKAKISIKLFKKYFGIQTCPSGGVYPWDAEAVLERIRTGKLIGTQESMD